MPEYIHGPLGKAMRPREAEAAPDEAFELGRISGYDEAMREAHIWAIDGCRYFEQHADGAIGDWWLGQIRRVFGSGIQASIHSRKEETP